MDLLVHSTEHRLFSVVPQMFIVHAFTRMGILLKICKHLMNDYIICENM